MQLDGMILTKCPPDALAALLLDATALRETLPKACDVQAPVGDTIKLVLRRKIGPINLNMPGTLVMKRRADGKGYDLDISASHIVAGRVHATLHLEPGKLGERPRLAWTGELEAHGLVARLIADREARVNTAIASFFTRLQAQALTA